MSRFRRFSLRALLLAITLSAIGLGILGNRLYQVKQQTAALVQIEALGGMPLRVNYRDGIAYNMSGLLPAPKRKKWMYKLLGDDYFTYVPYIKLRDASADDIRAMIPHIQQLRLKEGMNEAGKANIALDVAGNPHVDAKLLQLLQEQLPQCVIVAPDPAVKGAY